jgi:hypothetical protein
VAESIDRGRRNRRRAIGFCHRRGGRRGLVGRCERFDPGEDKREARDGRVQGDRDVGRDRHVVDRHEVEAGEQAAEDRARRVAAVEEPEPRHAVPRRLDPAGDRRKRRAHQQRRRQQAGCGDQPAHEHPDDARAGPRGVDAAHERHREEQQQAEGADPQFQPRIHAQRMHRRRHVAREEQAAEAHAAHERPEQHAHRDRRGSDHELEQLEPDDFVDESGTPAADEQQEQRRENATRCHESFLRRG